MLIPTSKLIWGLVFVGIGGSSIAGAGYGVNSWIKTRQSRIRESKIFWEYIESAGNTKNCHSYIKTPEGGKKEISKICEDWTKSLKNDVTGKEKVWLRSKKESLQEALKLENLVDDVEKEERESWETNNMSCTRNLFRFNDERVLVECTWKSSQIPES